jgi:hypothetical protein
MVGRAARSMIFPAAMVLVVAMQGELAMAQAPPGTDWCRWCFVFQEEAQVGPSQFDLRFDNRCAVPIYFNYRRQPGDNGEPKADDRFTELVPPGEQTRRCVGSRSWRCTPIVTYRFACLPPLQRYPPPRLSA